MRQDSNSKDKKGCIKFCCCFANLLTKLELGMIKKSQVVGNEEKRDLSMLIDIHLRSLLTSAFRDELKDCLFILRSFAVARMD